MAEILETEVLRHCLAPIEAQNSVAALLEPKQLEEIRAKLAQLLLEEAGRENAHVVAQEVAVPVPPDFKSVISIGKGNRIIAFNFTDAAVDSALQILGQAIALYTVGLGPASVAPIAVILKTLWGKLVVLKRPGDSDAIDLLEALTRVRARCLNSNEHAHPTTLDVQSDSRLSAESAKLAFSKLRTKGIVKIVAWGGQEEDVAHLGNRWAIKL